MKKCKGTKGALDRVFSTVIRERVNWSCEACQRQFEEGSARMALHCSHFLGRAYHGTRWHVDNAFSHCATCHREFSLDPHKFARWAESQLGEGLIQILREKANNHPRYRESDYKAMLAHYKAELKRLQAERNNGTTGRIEVVGYE